MGYDNSNSGAIFRNERKVEGDNLPDYTGTLDVNGLQYFVSLKIKLKEEGPGKTPF